MGRHISNYKKVINKLDDLKRDYPNFMIGRHITTAIDGEDLWSMDDVELLAALTKYEEELALDNNSFDEDYVAQIQKDAENLNLEYDEDRD
jgi:hypothetical protein